MSRDTIIRTCSVVILITMLWGSQGLALYGQSSSTLLVDGMSNIFGAGHASAPDPGTNGGGILPPYVSFASGTGKVLRFTNVSGTVCLNSVSCAGPDGGTYFTRTNVSSYQGISGIIHNSRTLFLVGVFLGPTEPTDPAPSRLDFSTNDNFSTLSPVLGQTFFIGDGLTGTGSGTIQEINIPSGATRLFLGFADAFDFSTSTISGLPGFYADNSGSLTTQFTINLPGPPPSSGLISWWSGEGNANDVVGGHHGFLRNGTSFSPGKVCQAF